jgi:hypothetical protein
VVVYQVNYWGEAFPSVTKKWGLRAPGREIEGVTRLRLGQRELFRVPEILLCLLRNHERRGKPQVIRESRKMRQPITTLRFLRRGDWAGIYLSTIFGILVADNSHKSLRASGPAPGTAGLHQIFRVAGALTDHAVLPFVAVKRIWRSPQEEARRHWELDPAQRRENRVCTIIRIWLQQ